MLKARDYDEIRFPRYQLIRYYIIPIVFKPGKSLEVEETELSSKEFRRIEHLRD